MTDKQLIKEEIKRRMDNLWYLIPEGEKVLQDNFTKDDANNLGKYTALESLLQLIDSMPEESDCEVNCTTKSEDLDFLVISLEETIGTSPHSREVIKEHLQKAAEWQKQQMKEALQTEYEKGRFDMREEMMKDAVEGTVKYEIGSAEIPQCDKRYQVLSNPAPIANAKLGDKVKIIIVKED